MIVVNQDRSLILETGDLWRNKNSIHCNSYTSNRFNIKLATYANESNAFYVFENMLKHFTDKEPYYLPSDNIEVKISAEEIKFIDNIEKYFSESEK